MGDDPAGHADKETVCGPDTPVVGLWYERPDVFAELGNGGVEVVPGSDLVGLGEPGERGSALASCSKRSLEETRLISRDPHEWFT
jgi:hypothetical protein